MINATRVGPLAMLALILCLTPSSVDAYVGPGSGITVIGAALALVGGVILAIIGFIWYPIKRLLRRSKQPSQPRGADSAVS